MLLGRLGLGLVIKLMVLHFLHLYSVDGATSSSSS